MSPHPRGRIPRGRRATLWAALAVLVILVALAPSARGIMLEHWYGQRELSSEDPARRHAAVEWLGSRGTSRAAAYLLRAAGERWPGCGCRRLPGSLGCRREHRMSERPPPTTPRLAVDALRKLPFDPAWYLSRLLHGSEAEREPAIERLAELRAAEALPHLRRIASSDDALAPAAALAMARIQPALRIVRIVDRDDSPRALVALENRTPRSLYFAGYSLRQPLYSVFEKRGDEWTPRGGWCGTGVREVELPPGSTTSFHVPLGPTVGRLAIRLVAESSQGRRARRVKEALRRRQDPFMSFPWIELPASGKRSIARHQPSD